MFNMCLLLVLCSSAVLAHQIVMDHVGQTLPPYNETGIIKKNFDGETLAFVTPWNGKGYDVIKNNAAKFDYVSPVWLQIRPNVAKASKNKFIITGHHDIDAGWVSNVQNQGVDVLPRLQFDWAHWKENDFQIFFSKGYDESTHLPLIESIINLVEEKHFDGIVIEWGFVDTSQIIHVMKPLLRELHVRLHFNQKVKQLFLVIPPYRGAQQTFNTQHYGQLIDIVDRFCVMTYDHSGGRPGPNAPLKDFVIPTIQYYVTGTNEEQEDRASKLLLGLAFYGYDYQFTQQKVDAIVGHQYLEYMNKYKPKTNWDEAGAEQWMDFSDDKKNQHRVYYPSVKSIEKRLQAAKEKKLAGVMIWEAGQGLDEFLNVL